MSPTTSRSTTAGDGRCEPILSSPRPKLTEHHKTPSRQISRLYQPLSASNSSLALDSDEENESGTQLLPLYNKPDTPPSALFPQNNSNKKGKARARSESLALADVWDEREELFGVGDADEGDDEDKSDGVSDSEEHTTPAPPVWPNASRDDTKPAKSKSVRWAEGSA